MLWFSVLPLELTLKQSNPLGERDPARSIASHISALTLSSMYSLASFLLAIFGWCSMYLWGAVPLLPGWGHGRFWSPSSNLSSKLFVSGHFYKASAIRLSHVSPNNLLILLGSIRCVLSGDNHFFLNQAMVIIKLQNNPYVIRVW